MVVMDAPDAHWKQAQSIKVSASNKLNCRILASSWHINHNVKFKPNLPCHIVKVQLIQFGSNRFLLERKRMKTALSTHGQTNVNKCKNSGRVGGTKNNVSFRAESVAGWV